MGELVTEPYTPTTEEVRMAYVGEPEHWLDDKVAAEFDRWFASEIEKAEQRGREAVWGIYD